MEDITNSLKTLSHIATQIDMLLHLSRVTYTNRAALDQNILLEGYYRGEKYSTTMLSVNLNNVIIFANAYLDELNGQLTPAKYPADAEKILAYRRVVKPALKRIRKWTHLKDLRNELLVHNYRVKDVSIFSVAYQKKEYNAPAKDQEILLLGDLILLINKQLFAFFPEEIGSMLAVKERIIDKYKATDNPINYREEIAAITQQVEELKKRELE